jgi:hypothetical protein
MTNENGGAYRLTAFLGPDNIRLIPAAEFSCDILTVTLQDGPINLLHPDFNLTSVKTDSTTIAAKISSKIIRLAIPSILDHLFNQLCPGYSKEHHAALDHIRQTYNDATGNTIFSSVYEYYTPILTASCPFIDQEVLPISICPRFLPPRRLSYPLSQLQSVARMHGNSPAHGPSGHAPSRQTCRNGVHQHQDNR